VIQRRLESAAQYMLETDVCLSDIALRCGFTDQPHLCKHFRQATGETPAAWRRARRRQDFGNGAASSCNEGMAGEDRPIEESVNGGRLKEAANSPRVPPPGNAIRQAAARARC
jgi:hypothetical protein